ncbi:hypothetical protein HK096_000495, partial [Nowakowskiella sp. JEL0078]
MECHNLRRIAKEKGEESAKLKCEIEKKDVEIQKLMDKLEIIQNELQKSQSENLFCEQRVKESSDLISELQSKLLIADKQKNEFENQLSETERAAEAARSLAETLRNETKMIKRISTIPRNIILENDTDNHGSNISELHSQINEKDSRISDLYDQLNARDAHTVTINNLLHESERETEILKLNADKFLKELKNILFNLSSILKKREVQNEYDEKDSQKIILEINNTTNILKEYLCNFRKSEILYKENTLKIEFELTESRKHMDLVQIKLKSAESSADKAQGMIIRLQDEIRKVLNESGFGGPLKANEEHSENTTNLMVQQLGLLKRVSAAAQSFAATQRMENIAFQQLASDKDIQINELQQSLSTSNAQISRLKYQLTETEATLGENVVLYSNLRHELESLIFGDLIDGENYRTDKWLVSEIKRLSPDISKSNGQKNLFVSEITVKSELENISKVLNDTESQLSIKISELVKAKEKISLLEKNTTTINQIVELLKNEIRYLKESNSRLSKESQTHKERAEVAVRLARSAQYMAKAGLISNDECESNENLKLHEKLHEKERENFNMKENLKNFQVQNELMQKTIDALESELAKELARYSNERELQIELRETKSYVEMLHKQYLKQENKIFELEKSNQIIKSLAESLRNENSLLKSGQNVSLKIIMDDPHIDYKHLPSVRSTSFEEKFTTFVQSSIDQANLDSKVSKEKYMELLNDLKKIATFLISKNEIFSKNKIER